jgi:hypothetical protein
MMSLGGGLEAKWKCYMDYYRLLDTSRVSNNWDLRTLNYHWWYDLPLRRDCLCRGSDAGFVHPLVPCWLRVMKECPNIENPWRVAAPTVAKKYQNNLTELIWKPSFYRSSRRLFQAIQCGDFVPYMKTWWLISTFSYLQPEHKRNDVDRKYEQDNYYRSARWEEKHHKLFHREDICVENCTTNG